MSIKTYGSFLASKALRPRAVGPVPGDLHSSLYPFQRDITRWAIRQGRGVRSED